MIISDNNCINHKGGENMEVMEMSKEEIMKNAMEDVDSTEDIPEGAAKDAPENLIKDIAIEERAFVGCPIKISNGEILEGLKCL